MLLAGTVQLSGSGRYLWRYTPDGAVPGPVAHDPESGLLLLHADDRHLYTLDNLGRLISRVPVSVRPGPNMEYLGRNRLLAQLYDGGMGLLSRDQGLLWRLQPEQLFGLEPAGSPEARKPDFSPLSAGNGYFIAFHQEFIAGVHPRGRVVWRRRLDDPLSVQPAAWGGGSLVGTESGVVGWYGWDGSRGFIQEFAGSITGLAVIAPDAAAVSVAIAEDMTGMVVIDAAGEIRAFREFPGSALSLQKIAGYGESPAVLVQTGSALFVWAYETDRVYGVRGTLQISSPAEDGTVMGVAPDGSIVQIDPRSGMLWQGNVPGDPRIVRFSHLSQNLLITHEDRWTLHAFTAPGATDPITAHPDFDIPLHTVQRILDGFLNNREYRRSLNLIQSRRQPEQTAGRIIAHRDALLAMSASQTGAPVGIRIQAVHELSAIGGQYETVELRRIAAGEQDPLVRAAIVRTLGRIGTDWTAAAAIGDIVSAETEARMDGRVAAAAVAGLGRIRPYLTPMEWQWA
ncbi:MAG: hypothetical protein ACOC0D_00185, partial [Spirochaeta sp.]